MIPYPRPEWADDTIGRAWWEFHKSHPEVYGMLLNLAEEWLAARGLGRRCGMKMLWERLRWEHAIGNLGDADFKLNNNYTSLYARYMMQQDHRLIGRFETRERRSEQVADKPDPVAFTAYLGCPNGTCPTPTDCRTVGECYALGEPTPDEMDEDAVMLDVLGQDNPSARESSDAYVDRVQPWE